VALLRSPSRNRSNPIPPAYIHTIGNPAKSSASFRMKRLDAVPLSVLDLSPITAEGSAGQALRNSLDLAKHAETWGFRRFWVAEHHSMPGIASAATSVVIGFIAGGTSRIRVGSGGIMLPNHAPMMIAEQFGTLEALYPGRIDLGLGRAPGTDPHTVRALRRGLESNGDDFPQLLEELRGFLRPADPFQRVRAVPGAGTNIPIWLLGSGGFSARLAGQLGLPFAAAGHFAPANLLAGLEIYRRSFVPSATLEHPYAMVGVNVIAAETDEAAHRLATSHRQAHLHLIRNAPQPLPPPVDSMDGRWTPEERTIVETSTQGSIIGSPATVRTGLERLVAQTDADELMVHAMIHDHAARLRSYEMVSEVCRGAIAAVAA
jgi:luciferase family oxidoreductase group 1